MDKTLLTILTIMVGGTLSLLGVVIKISYDWHIEKIKNDYQKGLEAEKAKLKENSDVKINRTNVLNTKKIAAQEELFHHLDALTILDHFNSNLLILETLKVEQYIKKHNLLIDKPLGKIAHGFLDYFKMVASSPGSKDFIIEERFLDEYTQEFHR
ncbi:MAG: hypothetical protein ACO1OF_16250 [Adhaeribacter sp.]